MKPNTDNGVKHWRSMEAMQGREVPSAWQGEFPEGAFERDEGFARRNFMKLMGASFGLAGLGLLGVGCRRPEELIMPFGQQPENYIHGVPQYFASARPARTGAISIVVESNEGRPTKIEGNPEHPDSNGSTDMHTQASILDLYDPDRARGNHNKDKKTLTRDAALEELDKLIESGRTALLMGESTSPSRARILKQIGNKAQVFTYEPIDDDIHRRSATEAFGKDVRPYYRLDQASTILSLDCDFVGVEADTHRHIRDYAKGRKLNKGSTDMSRLYVVEPRMSQTGANADHRLRVKAGAVHGIASAIAVRLGIEGFDGKHLPKGVEAKWLDQCVVDLKKSGVVMTGQGQPLAVHVLAHAINQKIGAIGSGVQFLPAPNPGHGTIEDLAKASFDVLVILGGNPAYNAPSDIDWKNLVGGKTVVRLGYYDDESAVDADLFLAQTHFLEEWGDARTSDGTTVAVQPLIKPLFDGLSELEVLARIADEAKSANEIVQATVGRSGDSWKHFLHDGFDAGTKATPVKVGAVNLSAAKQAPEVKEGELEVIFARDSSVDDGSFANNGWCQELPDPITKITWDNAVLVSRVTAKKLGWSNGDVVKIGLDGRSVEGPVWIQPGQADETLALALGYGRDKGGRIANFDGKQVGFNAYKIRTSEAPGFVSVDSGKVGKAKGSHNFACTQDHWSMEGRAIVREANLEGDHGYQKHKDFAHHVGLDAPDHAKHTIDPKTGKPYPIYQHPYDAKPELKNQKVQWGMSIDLNSCVGCNACVIACQSENNIPIVGKDQVERGREMSWLRIDRYYTGFDHDPGAGDTDGDEAQAAEEWIDDPQVVNQPMLCQHCEAAPCELVCPVNATAHDDEGLNVMVYNRCIGTRYCSNNCAWKVRRFNYFDYNKRPLNALYKGPLASNEENDPTGWDLVKMAKNPEVTVRMRGVMEKCTYCVQRIEEAKIARKREASREYKDALAGGDEDIAVSTMVADGKIKTACQQVCSAEAIVFGNQADPKSEVSILKEQERDYTVLGFLDARPHTTYLAQVRNPNLEVPGPFEGYYHKPLSAQEYDAVAHGGDHHDENGHDDHKEDSHKGESKENH